MKKIICAAALGAAVLSFASAKNYTGVNAAAIKDVPTATSFTATTTKGLFSTDVDDFISVTDFWGVQPENSSATLAITTMIQRDSTLVLQDSLRKCTLVLISAVSLTV